MVPIPARPMLVMVFFRFSICSSRPSDPSRILSPGIVILFGLARRTVRKSRKYHYFTVRGREVFDGLERQAVALDHVAVGEQVLVAPVAIVRRLPGEPGRPACGAGGWRRSMRVTPRLQNSSKLKETLQVTSR